MPINNISNILNNRIRFTGLSTGLDTDKMISDLMKVERLKVDRVVQKRELAQWKRDDYRSMTSILKGFSNEYFDVLKPSSNIRSRTSFSSFTTKYDGADTSSYFTATAGSGATGGTYEISNIVMAKVAKVEGSANVAAGITGSSITDFNINAAGDNNKITVNFNGSKKEITVEDNPTDITALQSDLQAKIDAAFGKYADNTSKINVQITGAGSDQLSFSTNSTNTLAISHAYNQGNATVFGSNLAGGVTLDNQNNKFKLTLDGTTKDIALNTGAYADTDAMLAEVQAKIDAVPEFSGKIRALNQNDTIVLRAIGTAGSATGPLATADVSGGTTVDSSNSSLDITLDGVTKTITLDEKAYTKNELLSAIQSKIDTDFGAGKGMASMDGSNHLRFESISSTSTLSTASKENGGLSALGLTSANVSNKISLGSSINSIKDHFSTPFVPGTADVDGNDINFTINGQSFKFNSSTASLNTIMNAVNNSSANVTMKYDQFNDQFTMESKDTGTTAKVEITEQNGNLMASLGLKDKTDAGEDASITIDGQTVVRDTNTFNVSGMTFDIKADHAGPVSLSVSADPTKTLEFIKGFVNKYNEVVEKINNEIHEERNRSYLPLTDEQKSGMSDRDVEKWEETARSGMLRNDNILNSMLSNMRRALYDTVSDAGISLTSIGISTGSYSDRGKLIINEEKLKQAIIENPEKITNLFTKESQYSYAESLDDPSKRQIRYQESGLGQRLYDILQDNIRTTRDSNGKKGILLEKAGMVGDLSEFTNTINKEMETYDEKIEALYDKLLEKENSYYERFAALERMIGQMNAQSSWISSQLGGG